VDPIQLPTTTDPGSGLQGLPSRLSFLRHIRTIESFQFHDFRWLWLGTLFAFMAINMQQITRGWLIRFWHLMVIGFINGTLAAFNMPSRQSIVSDIVPPESLMNAISLNSAGMNLTRTIGPAVAGFLIIYLDTAGVFYLIAGIYAFSIICMAMMTFGFMPLSAVPFGALAERIGTPDSLALSGVILSFAAVGFFFSFPNFRTVE